MEPPSMAALLGLPPGFHFVPTDEEVVRLHLLPCILEQPQPPSDIIVDDPLSAPPWDLLEKHGRKKEAFFFAAGQAVNAKGSRQKRTCEGRGTWQGQGKRKREEEGEKSNKRMRVSVCGSTREVEWEKYALNFHECGVRGSTGWVMHEYSITSPPEFARSPMRLYCIRHSGHGKNAKKYGSDAQDWGSDDEDEDKVDGDATLATTSCAAEEYPALFIGEHPLVPQAGCGASLPVAVANVVSAIPADGMGAGAGNDQNLPVLMEDNATSWCAAVEDPALIGDYPLAPQAGCGASLPVVVPDVANAIPADGMGAGAGNDQDLPALVEDDATSWYAADPAMLIGEYPLAPHAEYYMTSLSVSVADVVNAIPADGMGAGAGNDQNLPALVEDNATSWCAAVEDPALIGAYPLAPQVGCGASLPMAVADAVNAIPADGMGAGAGIDQDLPALVENDATSWYAAEEDPALFIGEYPLAAHAEYMTSLSVAAPDAVNAIPADGMGSGAANDQDLPVLVEDDDC